MAHGSSLADAGGRSTEGGDANYANRFECLPLSTPWRPDRVTEKPRIHSIQTARVTGPVGLDIHTDPYGRVRVRFPWDRTGESLAGDNSCWIRVSQAWAGAGSPGFLFIPRVGMEVVVAFIDGDPDRPLITGCVYNGENPTPGLLPIQATKSMIRTRTVPHGPGYNELSFEDAMGHEKVLIRAERDFDTRVGRNRDEAVRRDTRLSVGGNRTVDVQLSQRVVVGRNRDATVMGDETRTTRGNLREYVAGSQRVRVEGEHSLEASEGVSTSTPNGPWYLSQGDDNTINVSSDEEHQGIILETKNALIKMGEDRIELRVGRSRVVVTEASIRVNGKVFPSQYGAEPSEG